MLTQEQMMREAAAVIQSALRAVGCNEAVTLIDHDTAIRIGTFAENLTVRCHEGMWQVLESTPYMQRMRTYANLEECAHDIALCEPGVLFDQVEEAEKRIDKAIEETEAALHR